MNAKARALFVVVTAMFLWMCGSTGMESLGDAMVDMGQSLQDGAMSDAAAQSTCGTCTGGAVHMMTADTDPTRTLSGALGDIGSDRQEMVTGPAFITDIFTPSGITTVYLHASTDCSVTSGSERVFRGSDSGLHITGARIFVPSGQALCGLVTSRIVWSGYRPYD